MRPGHRLHGRILGAGLKRLALVLHLNPQTQLPSLGKWPRQSLQLRQHLWRGAPRQPAPGPGQGATPGRAIKIVAPSDNTQINPLCTGKSVCRPGIEFELILVDPLNKRTHKADRIVRKGHVLRVLAASVRFERDSKNHRPHAHHPQRVAALDNQDPISTNSAAVAIGNQRQRSILLRLDLLVPHNSRQPQVPPQFHPAFYECLDRAQSRGHSPLHIRRPPSVHAVALATSRRAVPHGNRIEMAIEHQGGTIPLSRNTRVEIVPSRTNFPHIDIQTNPAHHIAICAAHFGFVHGHTVYIDQFQGPLNHPFPVNGRYEFFCLHRLSPNHPVPGKSTRQHLICPGRPCPSLSKAQIGLLSLLPMED